MVMQYSQQSDARELGSLKMEMLYYVYQT